MKHNIIAAAILGIDDPDRRMRMPKLERAEFFLEIGAEEGIGPEFRPC